VTCYAINLKCRKFLIVSAKVVLVRDCSYEIYSRCFHS